MSRENQPVKEDLLGRLLDRLTFPWSEEEQMTIREKITAEAGKEANEKIARLTQDFAISPLNVVEKIRPRAASWQLEKLLGHTWLKRIIRLSFSSNLFLTKKPS